MLLWRETNTDSGASLFRRSDGAIGFLSLPGLYESSTEQEDGSVNVYDYNLLSANLDRQGDRY